MHILDDTLRRTWTILVSLFVCGFLLAPQMHHQGQTEESTAHHDQHAHHMQAHEQHDTTQSHHHDKSCPFCRLENYEEWSIIENDSAALAIHQYSVYKWPESSEYHQPGIYRPQSRDPPIT